MSHPQLLSQLLGRPLPAATVEECPADVPAMTGAMESSDREQAAQARRARPSNCFRDVVGLIDGGRRAGFAPVARSERTR